jgi:uncharacterized glyoxalase superfamily protein PhnB
MSDPRQPTGGDAPDRDPFHDLRLPAAPLAPRPAFAAELRRRIQAALASEAADADRDPSRPDDRPDEVATPTRTDGAAATVAPTPRSEHAMSTTDPSTTGSPTDRPRPVLTPYLAVPRATEAITWYRDVLGAVETTRFVGDDGRVGHCELVIAGSTIMLADEFPEVGVHGPGAYGGTPVMLHLEVVDVDHTYQRAVDAGAEAQRPPADQGHGNRTATLVDPFGHRWMLSQPVPDATSGTDQMGGTDAGDTGSGETPSAETRSGETGSGDTEAAETRTADGWTVTGRAPVEPGYLTINPDDPRRATAFFGALFGWEVHGGPDGGGHVANTRFPLGIAGPQYGADAGHGPTTVYFRVDDPEHYARRVEELGGRVLARNAYDSGASVRCEDDQGYRFELWQPAPGY